MIHLSKNDILLFQGDSITHGGRVYSDWDMNHIMGHGYPSIVAGKLALENIENAPEIINRGVSGDTVGKLIARWNEDTLALNPTILSLLIGTNDCGEYERTGVGPTPEIYNRELRFLLNYTKEVLPDIKLIIGEPFYFAKPSGFENEEEAEKFRTREKNTFECAGLARKIAEDFGAVFVPYYETLKKYVDICPKGHIIWDGIHPTFIGHEIMARLWYETVDKSGLLK